SMWHAMSSRPAARLAPCSKLSRTLRAGVAGAARAASWTAPARGALPAAGRDEGMVACGRTKGWTQERKGRKERARIAKFSLDFGSPIQAGAARAASWTAPARGALPAAGRDEGMVACGRTKGWTQERKGKKERKCEDREVFS